jgi:sugar phosphate isomerase/epimerase
MAIQYNILQRGFKNLPDDANATGFQLLVKTGYYRGVALSLIEDVEVIVDGERFERDAIGFRVAGRTYRLDEMEHIGDVHWPWLEPAAVIVDKPGGLTPGVHDVVVVVKLRISYMPFNPVPSYFHDKLVLMPGTTTTTAAGSPATATPGSPVPVPRPKLCVSLYSYNGDLQAGTMTLEDCLADLCDLGCEGVEFLPEAIVPDYPHPPKAWIDQWHGWMEKYRLTPVALDGGADTKLYKHRRLSLDEIVDLIALDLALANALGCRVYRGLGSAWPAALDLSANVGKTTDWKGGITPFQIYEKLLPLAEKYDVRIGEELHIPFLIESDWLEETIALIERTGTKHLGFVPDLSIFVRRPPAQMSPEALAGRGTPKEVVDYIVECRENLVPEEDVKQKVAQMNAGPMGIALVAMIYHLTYSTRDRNEVEQLAALVPYSVHIHGKFYDVLEDLSDEYSIPYSELVPALARAGYANYLSSEYEGDRTPFVASNQVRRHHLMVRRMWEAAVRG